MFNPSKISPAERDESEGEDENKILIAPPIRGLFSIQKWPAKSQWRQFFKILGKKEKICFFVFLGVFLVSFTALSLTIYWKNTKIAPTEGGSYVEGIVGSPRFINPVYAASFDTDRDLIELIYSGLMKYDGTGKIVPDLVKKYEISEDGRVYEFYLKENLFWSDGQPLTADDVIFTIKAIQNPSLKSPIRPNWIGVKVKKLSDLSLSFELENSSAVFLENTTLKILPKHIWEEVSSQNFPLSIYNLKPVGSGPYKLKELNQDQKGNIKSMELAINPYSAGNRPYISKIILYFFALEDELIKAFNSGEVKGFSLFTIQKYKDVKVKSSSEYHFSLPRYFALFFNPEKANALSENKIRLSLNYATDKKEIIDKVLLGNGKAVDSPILPEIYGFEEPKKTYGFNPELAKKLLEEAGYTKIENGIRSKVVKKTSAFQFQSSLRLGSQGQEVKELQKCLANPPAGGPDIYPGGEITGIFGAATKKAVIAFQNKYKTEILDPQGLTQGTGEVLKATRNKLNALCASPIEEKKSLSFSISTVDQPALKDIAQLLKKQWEAIGVQLDINIFDASNPGEEVIKPRNYEILLFGEVLGMIPDPYPFWHSSQTKSPGLNLTNYADKTSDKLLENARETLNEKERKMDLEKFQELLIASAPAVFLYTSDYLYFVSKEIKGIDAKIIADPSKRFNNIENWYIKTKRV
ncbi:MAG: ABC transporter substrate-binding protein, partial [bacterium]|nr:ABC transporter substrate-binding protein [bacterium]